tara:strand:- start:794 stop:967 length:174 start_codon:yes stop_codon:yes gene_type:complete
MNFYSDPAAFQLAILFPFIPLICVGIVTFALGYDMRDDNDDDDDDRGTLVPVMYPAS